MNKQENSPFRGVHHVGATFSLACAVHCLATPLLVSVLPLVGLGFFASERFEWAMLSMVLLMAILSSASGLRTHGRRRILIGFGVGSVFMLAGHLFEGLLHGIVVGAGGFVLSICQLINRRWCRVCGECNCEKTVVGGLQEPESQVPARMEVENA